MLPRSDRPPQARLQSRQSPDRQGAVRKQTRCYALKLLIAGDAKVDPGNSTDTELRSRGAEHDAPAGIRSLLVLRGVIQPS